MHAQIQTSVFGTLPVIVFENTSCNPPAVHAIVCQTKDVVTAELAKLAELPWCKVLSTTDAKVAV